MNKNKIISLVVCIFLCHCCLLKAQDFKPDESFYGIDNWVPDTLGNHRAVIEVSSDSPQVWAHIPWRRRDKDPQDKGIIIKSAVTGRDVKNIYRAEINREYGDIIFQPESGAGQYFVYFLPYRTSGGPYPKVNYPKEKDLADPAWVSKLRTADYKKLSQAALLQFQALSEFDKFYPMEIIATRAETQQLLANNTGKDYLLFPEDRLHPVKMYQDIPYRWAVKGAQDKFVAEVDQNEFFPFQIGLWAAFKDVRNVKISFSDMTGKDNTIPASAFTCINTEGVDWLQRSMKMTVDVAKGKVQPFWVGVQIPRGIKMGVYTGKVTITSQGMAPQTIDLYFNISSRVLTDHGDGELWRLSRLRWLNSTLAVDDDIVKPYTPVQISGNTLNCLGRSVNVGNNGLPQFINSYFTEELTTIGPQATPIIKAPFQLIIESKRKALPIINQSFGFDKKAKGIAGWHSANTAGKLSVNVKGSLEFDGFMEYHIEVEAIEDTDVDDIRLEIPMNKAAATYWLGMGQKGATRPARYNWKWDVKNNQEGFWMGAVNAGLHCVFRDDNYVRPLNTNFYELQPLKLPPSWYNNGRGGIDFAEKGNTVTVKAYSGKRTIKKGEKLDFIFLASITPFKPIDTEKQWADRYFHAYRPVADVVVSGANTINIHHANDINPYINYPFFRPDYMKEYIDEAHASDCKVKIYYTVRELANRTPELFALRSLGTEIFADGKGNGYAWLQEHLDTAYIAAWFVSSLKDAAIINSGVSRWHNFYIEGLEWLVENVGIDGLYIDDLAFDRTSMKRIRKVLERNRPEPRIDLHSANQYNKRDGWINSAALYMEHMPYLDRLWFGEYFDYKARPDYWMTEVSGLPFGMMSEMLEGGGNPWRGMVYGMTAREPYQKNQSPRYLWKVWDEFGIQGSRMMGYWVSYNPIKTSNPDVLVTSYIKDGKAMIAVASWAEKDIPVKLLIDWKQLGINQNTAKLTAPAIENFQDAMVLNPSDSFIIPAGKGFLFILE